MVPTAQLVRTERLAGALASHHAGVRRHPQPLGTRGEEIGLAAYHRAHAVALVRGDGQGDVEAVDEADAVREEVVGPVVEVDLRQRSGGCAAGSVALEAAAAVAGEAGEVVLGLGAVGAGPDPTRPGLGRGGEGAVGEGGEVEAATLEDGVAGVGLDAGPEGEGAVVDQSQKGCRGSGVGERAEDQECGEEEREGVVVRGNHCFLFVNDSV